MVCTPGDGDGLADDLSVYLGHRQLAVREPGLHAGELLGGEPLVGVADPWSQHEVSCPAPASLYLRGRG